MTALLSPIPRWEGFGEGDVFRYALHPHLSSPIKGEGTESYFTRPYTLGVQPGSSRDSWLSFAV